MFQAVSRRPLSADARVKSHAISCGICGGQSGAGIIFFRVLQLSTVIFIPGGLHSYLSVTDAV
jgi:hypothetical protein